MFYQNNYSMALPESEKLRIGPIPQRTQVAAWGLDANIAELKDAVSQV
jgi:hypothetical protein